MIDERPLPVGAVDITAKPAEFDGVWMIRRIHRLAENLGYKRVRADRGEIEPGCYYEVGYGPLFTVHLRTVPWDQVLQVTKENWNSVTEDRIIDFLARNAEAAG